jgi:hypothetical protein
MVTDRWKLPGLTSRLGNLCRNILLKQWHPIVDVLLRAILQGRVCNIVIAAHELEFFGVIDLSVLLAPFLNISAP